MLLATKYCQVKGIELGAAAPQLFGLADCLNVAPHDGEQYLRT